MAKIITECIIWHKAINHNGYGREWFNGRLHTAHRLAYERKFGKFEGVLDHLCKNRACVNPDHLEPVTIAENIRRGIRAKINSATADKIRRMYATGEHTQRKLGKLFDICQDEISRIINGKRWGNYSE